MKWIISLVVFMLLPVSVIEFESDNQHLMIKIDDSYMMIRQEHSVSQTPIEEIFMLTSDKMMLQKTTYQTQGGAGMPNSSNVIHQGDFLVERQEGYEVLYMVLNEENDVVIDDTKYEFSGTYKLETCKIPYGLYLLNGIGDL